MTESTNTQSLLLTREQAGLLLELAHKAAWSGATVRLIAPVIAQLESLAPPPVTADGSANPVTRGA
jgi:hypothetical protein